MTIWTDEHAAELQRRRLAGEKLSAIAAAMGFSTQVARVNHGIGKKCA